MAEYYLRDKWREETDQSVEFSQWRKQRERMIEAANRSMERVWPFMYNDIWKSYLWKHVVPVNFDLRSESDLPWTWDVRDCMLCGKGIFTAVLKGNAQWVTRNFCPECEAIVTKANA